MRCTYVSASDGVHDRRWIGALRGLGLDPIAVVAVSGAVELPDDHGPVLAGPLAVARELIGSVERLVGLSWGHDLHALADAGDAAWLASLDHLIVDSEATRDIAVRHGLPASAITLLPWGIDLSIFHPDGNVMRPEILGFAPSARMVVSLRAHEALYRIEDIVDAFPQVLATVPESVLVIGHSGSLTEELRARVAALGLSASVRFIGTVDEDALAPLLRGAACYVTASSVDGTSVTLLQAMASGVPVVASATPGNRSWVVPETTGWTFPTGDVHALGSSLIEALTRDCRAIVSEASTLVRERADWSRNVRLLGNALFPVDGSDG